MLTLILRILLAASVLQYVLPMVPGVHFTGAFFPDAIVYAVLFAVVAFVVDLLLGTFALLLTGATAGLAAPLIVIAFVLGWWLIPALQLMALASWFPHHFAIDSWGSAIIAGLVLLVINVITRAITRGSN